MEEFGKKGLNIISVTHESRETILKFLSQQSAAPASYTIGLKGGIQNYPNLTNTVPYVWLVGADGKVVFQGNTGGLSDKDIEAELRKVKMTPEIWAARGAKMLAAAEAHVAEKKALLGHDLLTRLVKEKEFKGSEAAKKADEKLKELDRDEEFKKELKAQQLLDKIVGGLDLPKEKLKGKERDGKKVLLEGFIKKNKEEAPVAASLAETWVKVMAEDWKAEK